MKVLVSMISTKEEWKISYRHIFLIHLGIIAQILSKFKESFQNYTPSLQMFPDILFIEVKHFFFKNVIFGITMKINMNGIMDYVSAGNLCYACIVELVPNITNWRVVFGTELDSFLVNRDGSLTSNRPLIGFPARWCRDKGNLTLYTVGSDIACEVFEERFREGDWTAIFILIRLKFASVIEEVKLTTQF